MRVVTLLPSATELVFALGVDPVGVSAACDYPPAARELPAVDRSRVDPDAPTREINRQVVAARREGGVYEIDVERLRELDPDLVVAQGTCEVCAVDEVLARRAVDEAGLDAEVLTTDPHSLADVFEDAVRIGTALGRRERAESLVADLRSRVEAVRDRAGDPAEGPRVAVLDWTDPPMVAGHWVPGMVEDAGGQYGLEHRGERSRVREWDRICEYDPELLVVAPCGFDLDRTRRTLPDLTDRPGWESLSAVEDGRAYAVDGNHYLNRPGPRLVDSLEHLAGLVDPDRFETPPPEVARPLSALEPADAD